MNEIYHIPAMLRETIQGLNIQPNGLYVDVTFGGGGHSRAILEELDSRFASRNSEFGSRESRVGSPIIYKIGSRKSRLPIFSILVYSLSPLAE